MHLLYKTILITNAVKAHWCMYFQLLHVVLLHVNLGVHFLTTDLQNLLGTMDT